MRIRLKHPGLRAVRQAGLTLVEIMVSVTLLVVIILGLVVMFDQTQKAFRSGVNQVDVLEGARATMQMLTTELEGMDRTGVFSTNDPYSGPYSFFSRTLTPTNQFLNFEVLGVTNQMAQQEFYFLTQTNEMWNLTGYRLTNDYPGVATLYRMSVSTNALISSNVFALTNLFLNQFDPAPISNPNFTGASPRLFSPVIQGIVHLRVTPLTRNPTNNPALNPINYFNFGLHPSFHPANRDEWEVRGVRVFDDNGWIASHFWRDQLPEYVELELGILEPDVLERLRAMPNPLIAEDYVRRQAGKVHFFVQRIPVRNAVHFTLASP
jgi:Tfp pilus assembly protein PilV